MTIRFVECRAYEWNSCADAIISKLKEKGVKKGQLLWIDAHNNGPQNEAIMSAFWDDAVKGENSPLDISFHVKNSCDSWYEFYEDASQVLATLPPENVISVTASCNYGGSAVMFVFYHECKRLTGDKKQKIWFCHETNHSYDTAAKKVIAKMKNEGAKAGQIIAIDVHNNNNTGDARFCAFWNRGIPSTEGLSNILHMKGKNDKDSWEDHYLWACKVISEHKATLQAHSITSRCNYGGNGVTFAFIEDDKVLDVTYDLDKGKISEAKPKVFAPISNVNNTPKEQKMTFTFSETKSRSTSNTSSYVHEVGAALKIGAEFDASIPIPILNAKVLDFKASVELTTHYTHTWGETTTITNDLSTSAGAIVEVMAPAYTEVICEFSIKESKLEVPYEMKLRSGRKSSGTWSGVSCWGLSGKYSFKPFK